MADAVPGGAAADARAANQRSYGDGESVRGYLADAYHRRRREIAVDLLAAALHRDGPVLELGSGSCGMLGG
ncbi:MAG TPA: hypothetical protein VJT31_39565, partial [Rugosimonospora sp.]|nr:hypothetical protein [Rugosimonospora sp.]